MRHDTKLTRCVRLMLSRAQMRQGKRTAADFSRGLRSVAQSDRSALTRLSSYCARWLFTFPPSCSLFLFVLCLVAPAELSGRIINIVVSPASGAGNKDSLRLLNYLTAPNVLVWSAALASCAIPGVYAPVELLKKDERTGKLSPYMEGDTPIKVRVDIGCYSPMPSCCAHVLLAHRSFSHLVLCFSRAAVCCQWEDGSVQADLPMQRLSELFNINHFIVSQVNPHVVSRRANTICASSWH